MSSLTKRKLTEADLSQFHGTEVWYRHPLNRKVLFTEGVKYVADEAGAYWLLDEIALTQFTHQKVAAEEFQVWKLKFNDTGRGASLICEDGNYNVVYTKEIDYTDFPFDGFVLWFENNVIMLPGER